MINVFASMVSTPIDCSMAFQSPISHEFKEEEEFFNVERIIPFIFKSIQSM